MKFADFITGFVGTVVFCVGAVAVVFSIIGAIEGFGVLVGIIYVLVIVGSVGGFGFAGDEADKRKKAATATEVQL